MSIVESAMAEMTAIGFPEEERTAMRIILTTFFETWDSGGAVAEMLPVLERLIRGKPLSPLTGEDGEWFDPMGDGLMLQNVRCGSIFKDWRLPDGSLSSKPGEGTLLIHDIDAKEPFAPIEFPYTPGASERALDPVIMVGAEDV